jgi:hypothetical protein
MWLSLTQPFVFSYQERDVTADEIAKQACFIRLYGDASLQVGTMPDTAASGG